jgi:hypothetical protein
MTEALSILVFGTAPTALLITAGLLLNNARLNDVRDLLRAEIRAVDSRELLQSEIRSVRELLHSEIARVETKVDTLQRTLDKRFEILLKKIEELDLRLTRLEERRG